jgi:hypothetical protein
MNLERFLRRGEILKRRAALSEQHHLHVDLLILSIFAFSQFLVANFETICTLLTRIQIASEGIFVSHWRSYGVSNVKIMPHVIHT